MDAPAPGSSAPPGPPGSGPARVDPLAAREAALAAREVAAAASEAAAAGLAQWAQGVADWAQWRLQVADTQEHDARLHMDAAHAWSRELDASIARVGEERDRLHNICAGLAEKEDDLMRRESALKLVLGHPPLPYPLIDPDSPNSIYSPVYSPVPASTPPPDSADASDPLA